MWENYKDQPGPRKEQGSRMALSIGQGQHILKLKLSDVSMFIYG